MRAALLGILTTFAWGTAFAAGGNCGQLATLTLPHTRITLAEIVPAGAFTPAKPFSLAPPGQQPSYKGLPAFCRVAVQVSPVPDSLIKFELWLRAMGGTSRLAEDYRLFMVPGMNHCRGGDGTDQFEAPMLTALEQWVEHGRAPDRIIASRVRGGHVDRTRPLCAYPEVAVYKGSGSTDQASSFACQRPR